MISKNERNKYWRERCREKSKKIFGEHCKICNSKTNICFHRKDGQKHNHYLTCLKAIKNPEQYILVCYPCHKSIHWIMKNFGWSWHKIETILNERKKEIY